MPGDCTKTRYESNLEATVLHNLLQACILDIGLRELVELSAAVDASKLEDQRKADFGIVLHDILNVRYLVGIDRRSETICDAASLCIGRTTSLAALWR